ncbi:MAG TPA: ferritin-like domain-containing protein [Terriglobales bacterium]|nr:ferritin-like domain-containing protein [Terriglobales bacterium]
MGSETYHEPTELLSEPTKEMHRALVSLIEELEAIDWYQQRAEASSDDHLRDILLHNRNEEIEHAMMTLEWIRRISGEFDVRMKQYLFTSGSIVEVEKEERTAAALDHVGAGAMVGASSTAGPCLGIGSLRGKE